VRINGKAAVVLAASPVCVVVLAELNSGTGPASILVQAPGVQWTAATTLVSLEFGPPRPALQPGQKGQIAVRVDGTSQKLRLVVEDRSPGVLRFEGGDARADARGDARRVATSGGPANIAEIKVQAITSGDYSLRARLVPTPDPRTAERFLAAAESLAPEDSRRKVSELASRLAHKPSDLENVEVALDKIATQTMTGDFRTLLDAARGVF